MIRGRLRAWLPRDDFALILVLKVRKKSIIDGASTTLTCLASRELKKCLC